MNTLRHSTSITNLSSRKSLAGMLILVAFVLSGFFSEAQTPLRFTRYVALNHQVGDLRWTAVPGAAAYTLYRHYPAQEGYSLVASIADTHYFDTIHRAICADTVSYYVEAVTSLDTQRSDTVGVYFVDDVPTTPCAVRVCTVDTAFDRIRLTWYPTPDTDAIGYYICLGSPCIDLDTVWGRFNTTYLCPDTLSTDEQHRFRILAFDSCYQASPLTPSYYNPSISFTDSGCTRRFSCSWNRYVNMPDSVGHYRLYYRLEDQDTLHVFEAGPDGPFAFDTVVDDLTVTKVTVFLSVDNTSDTLHALSQVRTRYFSYGDTAEYLRIAQADYDENVPSITLTIDIDSLFDVPECYVYRSQGTTDNFIRLATLDRGSPPSRYLYYVDDDINRAAGRYRYLVGVPDRCYNWIKESDTAEVLLPEVQKATAYFPNAIIYGHPDCGTFCPVYVSALSANYQLFIYTRWGQLVYQTTDIGACWDGTSPSGGPLPQGTYVYRACVSHADGTIKNYHGTILLIR